MFDILFDQPSQLPRFANLDPVVDRPEKAIALRLKGATAAIDELEHQHRRVMDDFPQVGHELDIGGRIRIQILEQLRQSINLLYGRIDQNSVALHIDFVVLDPSVGAHALFHHLAFRISDNLGRDATQEDLRVGILVNLIAGWDRLGQGPLTLHGEIILELTGLGRALIQGKGLPFGVGVGNRHCGAPLRYSPT